MPITPMEVSASLTSSSLNGLMIASIFFIRDPPGRVHSNRRAAGGSLQRHGKSGDSTTPTGAKRRQLAYEMGTSRESARVSGGGERPTAGAAGWSWGAGRLCDLATIKQHSQPLGTLSGDHPQKLPNGDHLLRQGKVHIDFGIAEPPGESPMSQSEDALKQFLLQELFGSTR